MAQEILIPTEISVNYTNAEKNIKALERQLESATRSRDVIINVQANLGEKMLDVKSQLEEARANLGNASNPDEWLKQNENVKQLEGEYEKLKNQVDSYEKKIESATNKIGGLKSALQDAVNNYTPNNDATEKLSENADKAKSGFGKLGDVIKKATSSLLGFNKASNSGSSAFGGLLKKFVLGMVGIRSVYYLFRKMGTALRESISNLAKSYPELGQALSSVKASVSGLSANIAAAISPIIMAVIPIINSLIAILNQAVTALGRFFDALSGKGIYAKAIANNKALAKSASGAAKANENLTASIDELNVLSESSGGGGGVEEEAFEPSENLITAWNKILDPIKKAWTNTSDYVTNAWGQALQNIKTLLADIGRDFAEVWNQPETIEVLETIFNIIGDIGMIVANLARQFDEAWNANDAGLHILETIRDYWGIIFEHIRNCTLATAEWAGSLNFTPLLEGIQSYLLGVNSIVDAIGGILEWIYIDIVLPLSQRILESTLPALLETVGELLDDVGATLSEVVLPMLQWVWDMIAEPIVSEFFDMVEGSLELLKETIPEVGETIRTTWEQVIKPALDKLGKAIEELKASKFGEFLIFLKGEWIKGIKQTLDDWLEKFDYIMEGIGELLGGLIDTLAGVIEFINGTFSGDWEMAWEGIKNIFKGIVNTIIGLFESMINKLIDGLNNFLENVNNISDTIGEVVGIDVPNLHVNHITLPRLAEGAVIPPNSKFLAMLGDQTEGTNVEAPLETIKEALVDALGTMGGTPQTQAVQVFLDGRMIESSVRSTRQRRGASIANGGIYNYM